MNKATLGLPERPGVDPPGVWRFPAPRAATLGNGLRVLAYHLPGQHVLAAQLVLDLPLTAEPRAAEGVATLCARSLDEGTQDHPGEAFAEQLENEGAGLGVDVSLSGLQVVVDVPVSRSERALPLLREAVATPELTDRDVDRHRQLRLAEIEQARANSAQAAGIAFRAAVFAPEVRAARMSGGEPDTVATVTPELVRTFHRAHVGPAGSTLVLAGDFTTDPVELAADVFESWVNPDQGRVEHASAKPGPRRAVIVDRPGSVQADLRLGGFGIDRHDHRWADATVAGYAMGGAFLSRLNRVLREERGYTYGVRLGFAPLRHGGSFAVQGSFRTEVLAAAVLETRQLLDVRARPFTDAEVTDAITYFAGVSPLRYATADGVADQVAGQVLADLPTDYVDRHLEALRAVTPESATPAYASLVDPDRLSLVVVGDAEALADPLRAAGFDDLEVVNQH